MRTIVMLAAALALAACAQGDQAPCPGASHVEATGNERLCVWQCTERDGHPVVLSWTRYVDGEAVDSETLAGFCVSAN